MKKSSVVTRCLMGVALMAAIPPSMADETGSWLDGIGIRTGGFIRQETAVSTTATENRNNQGGNPFNDQSIARTAYLPPTLGGGTWGNVPLGIGIAPSVPVLGPIANSLGLGNIGFSDSVARNQFVTASDPSFNYSVLRAETEAEITLGDYVSIIGRLRALYAEPVISGFNPSTVADLQSGGITGGLPALYHHRPNYFEYQVEGSRRPNPLEWAGKDYMVYFPALVADFHYGSLNLRVGQQQIAWGQSIFFRVFDTPNGIDLRRHLILGRALEEFSDIRVPTLSARLTYQVFDTLLADAYVGKFQPSIFGNPGTPYNVIPVQFTVHDRFHEYGYDDKLNYGLRLKADYGTWGWQAMAVRRYNQEGTFRWTESGVNKPLSGALGAIVNTAYDIKAPNCGAAYNPTTCRLYADSGEALSHTPFEASPAGVYSAEEWFNYAAEVRLNGFTGLNAAATEFAASRDMFASAIDLPTEFGGAVTAEEARRQAAAELNTFFMGGGGSLRGHIERTYHREDVFGLGVSYVNESENDFLNQLIFNLEVQYTPERTYTNTGLQQRFIKQNEYTVSLVIDKWHRLFQEFPGTYLVFQALTKNRSDLVGRHLSGYGSSQYEVSTGKKSNANYLVMGFLQPFPNKIWAVEFATLLDPDGGVLAQPLVQWNPGKGITVEAFYNYTNGKLWGKENNNLIQTVEWADEATVRLTYQF